MKRYRVLAYDFDTRANILKQEIKDEWKPVIKRQWEQNKRQIKEGIIAQFGAISAFRKIDNFVEIGAFPISIVAFHNKFLRQVRNAYVIGSYYPALTGACALGERILNHLIIRLRDDFKHTEQYKKVYGKNSFDNWDLAINTLESWDILLPEVVKLFKELKDLRNGAIHFNPVTDKNDKELALNSIKKLHKIIECQFSAFGAQPWFIPGIRGAAFIKKDYEQKPFVKRIILPNCAKVGPYHTLEMSTNGWIVKDDHEYEDKELTDDKFAEIFNNRRS